MPIRYRAPPVQARQGAEPWGQAAITRRIKSRGDEHATIDKVNVAHEKDLLAHENEAIMGVKDGQHDKPRTQQDVVHSGPRKVTVGPDGNEGAVTESKADRGE